jgi:hypothetical protein
MCCYRRKIKMTKQNLRTTHGFRDGHNEMVIKMAKNRLDLESVSPLHKSKQMVDDTNGTGKTLRIKKKIGGELV